MTTDSSANSANLDITEEKLAKLIADSLQGKGTLGAGLGLSENELEAMYAVGYNLYIGGKYTDAIKIFSVLSLLSPLDYRFIFGGASCFQMMGEYMMASLYYQLACSMNTEDPAPMMHTAECLLAVKDKDGAVFALEQVLERAGDKPQYEAFRKKAEVVLENVRAE
jgi:type III secretion low calcium response chaperone LcrH/SycD